MPVRKVDRRDFFRYTARATAVAGLAAMPHPASGISTSDHFPENFELEEFSIADLQKKMHSGELTAVKLVHSFLARIEQCDKHGPAINAIIELNPDAEAIARALDEERKSRRPRGPLHGVPIL